MWAALRTSWPLLAGMLLLMVANGLLVTLLTLRAASLGFGETVIGLVQSAYPVGSLLACLATPRLIARIGHVRVFAAMASTASTASLVHLVTVDAWSWGAMRMLAGFCYAGLYVVAESWLNAGASNRTRGSLLALYAVTQAAGIAAGQALLGLGSPDGILLFVVASVLVSLSLVPILVSVEAAPPYAPPERISLPGLYRISPMGVTGAFLNGIAQGAIYVALALYGQALGLPPGAIGALVACATVGGMLLQFPLGRLSDRIDRRLVIAATAGLAVPACLSLAMAERPAADPFQLYAGIALIGGLTLPIYALCVAHANDVLRPGQLVAASGSLVLVFGAGIVVGPTLGAFAIARLGAPGLLLMLAGVQGCTAAIALVRLWRARAAAITLR